MRAEPTAQLRLLDLQKLDTRAEQLAHRRRTTPQIAVLRVIDQRAAALSDRAVAGRTVVSDLDREVAKAESEVSSARQRRERDRKLLDDGAVASARQLADLQHEVENLTRRISDLEDAELEVLERLEVAQAEVDEVAALQAVLDGERAGLAAQRDVVFQEVDAEATQVAADRVHVVADLPAELVAFYERIRDDHGGVGAAALHRGRCEGCHLTLPPGDISRIRQTPEDELVRCEECRRILVRTPESGL